MDSEFVTLEIDEKDFWSRVDRSNKEGCWPYVRNRVGDILEGNRQRCMTIPSKPGFKPFMMGVHIIAWILSHDEDIPEGMLVCHKCDNSPCCNPDHLFLGTNSQNFDDMIAKHRNSSAGRRERTDGKRLEIQKYTVITMKNTHHMTYEQISATLGISHSTISSILKDEE